MASPSRASDVILGLVFFGALLGLGVVSIALSDYRFGAPRYDVDFISPDVGYLRPGDPVLLYGMPAGKVQFIQRLSTPRAATTPDGTEVICRVLVRARLEADLYARLPVDSRVLIQDRGLLGGRLLRIDEGTSDELFERGTPLLALERRSVIEAAGEVLTENRASLRRTIDNLASMSDSASAGAGLLGFLVRDEAAPADARALLADLRGSAADIREVTASVQAGEGTLGRLLRDESLFTDAQGVMGDARQFLTSARDVAAKINRGEGSLGRLLHDTELHDRAARFFDDMSSLSTSVREGRGLLGALLSDEQLAQDFRDIVAHVLGAIEDARESTPVQSAGSFLFGTF